MDDARAWSEINAALTAMRFTDEEREQLFRALMAILHLGNVEFEVSTAKTPAGETHFTVKGKSRPFFEQASQLLGTPAEDLERYDV